MIATSSALMLCVQVGAAASPPLPALLALSKRDHTLAADPDALHGSFAIYRALDITIAQNQQRKDRLLPMPVLAIGGAESAGEGPGATMRLAADDVQTVVLPGSGHWVA